ncbi:hypothetical protein D3C87_1654120 [compost metagenome]
MACPCREKPHWPRRKGRTPFRAPASRQDSPRSPASRSASVPAPTCWAASRGRSADPCGLRRHRRRIRRYVQAYSSRDRRSGLRQERRRCRRNRGQREMHVPCFTRPESSVRRRRQQRRHPSVAHEYRFGTALANLRNAGQNHALVTGISRWKRRVSSPCRICRCRRAGDSNIREKS